MINEKDEKKLRKIHVKDSKLLTPKKRKELAQKIEKIATHVVILRLQPCKIDSNRRKGVNLNQLEAQKAAEIINLLEPDKAIIDTPSYNSNKFRDYLWSKLQNKKIRLICENFADKNYPVVSAASILAKVDRDQQIEELKKRIGVDFGVGYPHDSRTIRFLNELAEKGKMPSYVRKSWDTVEEIMRRRRQKRIISFFKKLLKK